MFHLVKILRSNVVLYDVYLPGEVADGVENMWVLSLGLKLLHNSLRSADNCAIEELYAPDFIQCLVSVASKGTGFSQQWLLKDLEVS